MGGHDDTSKAILTIRVRAAVECIGYVLVLRRDTMGFSANRTNWCCAFADVFATRNLPFLSSARTLKTFSARVVTIACGVVGAHGLGAGSIQRAKTAKRTTTDTFRSTVCVRHTLKPIDRSAHWFTTTHELKGAYGGVRKFARSFDGLDTAVPTLHPAQSNAICNFRSIFSHVTPAWEGCAGEEATASVREINANRTTAEAVDRRTNASRATVPPVQVDVSRAFRFTTRSVVRRQNTGGHCMQRSDQMSVTAYVENQNAKLIPTISARGPEMANA